MKRFVVRDIGLNEVEKVRNYVLAVTRPIPVYMKVIGKHPIYDLEIDCGNDRFLLDRLVRFVEDQRDWRPSYTIEEV